MSGIATAIVGSSIITGMMGSSAASSAANTQAGAATQAAQLQAQTTREQLAQQQAMYDQNVARQQPWVTQGGVANTALADAMGISGNTSASGYGQLARQPTLADMQGAMNPQYQFMLDQGQQGLQAGAAARGGLLTGQGAKDVSNYNINAAGQGLQQGYNNYVANQTNLYNRLSGISTTGQNAAAGVGAQGTQVSSNMANTAMSGTASQNQLMTGAANAQAAGTMGSANAWTGAINTGVNSGLTMNYLNGMQQTPASTMSPTQAMNAAYGGQINLGSSGGSMIPSTTY